MVVQSAYAQTVSQQLDKAVKKMLNDSDMKHALMSLYVVNSTTGAVVYDLNSQVGLAPASCQKLITSVATLDILGADYRYNTMIGYDGTIRNDSLIGNLVIVGLGDPSFGSWRYNETKEDTILNGVVDALKRNGIAKYVGAVVGDDRFFESQTIPGGWIWDDIGNYYGAGASALNWKENQYTLYLQSGASVGKPAAIKNATGIAASLTSEVVTAGSGTGDNAYIYLPPYSNSGFVRGTTPLQQKPFAIAGSVPNPSLNAATVFASALRDKGIASGKVWSYHTPLQQNEQNDQPLIALYTHTSPALDTLNYWFLNKSVNLYGEAFVKTLAYKKTGFGSTDAGLEIVKKFWTEHGLDKSSLHIIDGSGLSPQNRITTYSLVTALQYARGRSWFPMFYNALPDYNQMKLKSGTLGGAKSYAGYYTDKKGTTYTLAIIVNNFDGYASKVVQKMYEVLNVLK